MKSTLVVSPSAVNRFQSYCLRKEQKDVGGFPTLRNIVDKYSVNITDRIQYLYQIVKFSPFSCLILYKPPGCRHAESDIFLQAGSCHSRT